MKIIITGGPCTGKSTLIDTLSKRGYYSHNEFARIVIKEQLTLNSNKLPWEDNYGFSCLVLERMHELNSSIGDGEIHFFDRGIPDLAAYLHLSKDPLPPDFHQHLKQANYHPQAFILPPWEDIFLQDRERRENFSKAIAIYEALKAQYTHFGFELIELPKLNVEERVDWVLTEIGIRK